MGTFTIKEFLIGCQIPEEHVTFVMKHYEREKVNAWRAGYLECVKHEKKRKAIIDARHEGSVKRFLDFLHDITHRA
jgi:hypothetical protein